MKTLIIAEKPSAAEAIAEALTEPFVKKRNYLESKDYYISWAIGHLVQLAEPEDYRSSLKRWRFEDLPLLPEFQLRPVANTEAQLKAIAALAKKSKSLINACDAAREGELIFRYIVAFLGLHHLPTWRLWTASLTPEAIREAMREMKPITMYDNLFASARCRSEGDWLIGINATRAFTTRFGELLSLGRVQTPVLAMICANRRLRDDFVRQNYWEVWANFQGEGCNYQGRWFQGEETRFDKREQAQSIAQEVQNRPGTVETLEQKESRELPPKLYDLTTLQRDCNRLFGFAASKTLKIAQELYDRKFITYPRTNSRYVDTHGIGLIRAVARRLGGHPVYGEWVQKGNPQLVQERNRNLCRPEAVEEHHAILPTTFVPDKLTGDALKVYDRIVRRLLAHYFLPARFKETRVITRIDKHLFRTDEKVIIDPGWKVVDGGWKPPEEKLLLPQQPGVPVRCVHSEATEKQTEPPKPYTEGSLLGAMETAGKKLDDEELREVLKDAGLGTPATRASIIERLKDVGYIELEGKHIEPTAKGMALIELVERANIPVLLSAEMTGRWEKYLNEIARANGQSQEFNRKVVDLTVHVIRQLAQADKTWYDKSACAKSLGVCPRCGGQIVENRKAYACSNWKNLNCPITIWKTFRGKKISEKTALALLQKGKSPRLRFYSKEKKPYPAIITFDRETGQMDLQYESSPKASSPKTGSTQTSRPRSQKKPPAPAS
ncbi:DNA topoisomerase III [Heliobacillus mobilis]|uniref:DNA topoisomerase n=1 Tax=Heliobacterium mobile TaxID=28064 RepID=A0A6I3SAZ3_HELMO|nr:type IA DNA topoisomerase [Heliobacterium mobile]MTV47438.1 DNA topoisomerase III [Heliobacterium mobile]